MSSELLSASGSEKEAAFLHGLLPEGAVNDWLLLGGDVRALQVHHESPERKSGRTVLMQAGLEVGAAAGAFTAVMFLGMPDQATKRVRAVSPRYYAMWNARDELAFRLGRFLPAFGINVPYHTLPTRQGLRLGAGQERDTLEGTWSGELWSFAASAGRSPDSAGAGRETLSAAQVNRVFDDSHRVGASALRGTSPAGDRTAFGVHGVFGFTPRLAYLTEFDWQWSSPDAGPSMTGLLHFSQLIWEARKGWHFYLMEDYAKSDLADDLTLVDSRGLGLRYFPRPHFELDLAWFKKRTAIVADRYDDVAWLLFHYYF